MGKPMAKWAKMWLDKKRHKYNNSNKKNTLGYGRDVNKRILNELYVSALKKPDDTGNLLGNISGKIDLKIIETWISQ